MIAHDDFIVSRLGGVSALAEWTLRLGLPAVIVLVGWLTVRRRAASAGSAATAG